MKLLFFVFIFLLKNILKLLYTILFLEELREEFILHKGKYDEAIDQLKAKLEEAEKQKREANRTERISDVDFEPVLEAKELTQEIMDTFIDHVDVFENERIDIHWRFDNE